MIGVPASRAAWASLAASRSATSSFFAAGLLLQPGDRLLDGLQVGQDHLGLDGGDVGRGVDLAVDMGDVLVAEDAGDLADRVGLADVGEELVAEPLALRRARGRCRRCRRTARSRAATFSEPKISASYAEPSSGTPDHADVGLDRRERVVRREHVVAGQRVEEGRLAGVGETDDPDGESHGGRVYGRGHGPGRIVASRARTGSGQVPVVAGPTGWRWRSARRSVRAAPSWIRCSR